MSWNGTVRCSLCYEKGHNKRSCPELVKRAKEEGEDSWAARELARNKAKGKVKRCSYCNLKGHNRATCEPLLAKAVEWRALNADFRRQAAEALLTAGYGTGAIILHDGASWNLDNRSKGLLLVQLNAKLRIGKIREALVVSELTNPSKRCVVSLPTDAIPPGYGRCWDATSVLAPTKCDLLHTLPDASEWLKGGSLKWIKREVLAQSQHDEYWENGYKD